MRYLELRPPLTKANRASDNGAGHSRVPVGPPCPPRLPAIVLSTKAGPPPRFFARSSSSRSLPLSARLGIVIFLLLARVCARADDWPQWLGSERDSVWRESGIIEKFPAGGPRGLWRAQIGGGYSGPVVAKGRV